MWYHPIKQSIREGTVMNQKQTIWNETRSILLSRVLLLLFAAALTVLDFFCLWLSLSGRGSGAVFPREKILAFTACLLLSSIPGFRLLWCMNRLLKNLQAARVFIPENVRLLRIVSYCCFFAAMFCAVFAAGFLVSLWIVVMAAGFVGLIVRIVKNVFEQAIVMQDELDFTV